MWAKLKQPHETNIIDQGQCPGAGLIGVSSNINVDHPTVAVAAKPIIFQGMELHKTHKIA